MSLKLRFALLFTIVVAFIQAITGLTIFYFYADHRKIDYQNKLRSEALLTYDAYLDSSLHHFETINLMPNSINDKLMYDKAVIVVSDKYKIISKTPSYANIDLSIIDYNKLKKTNEVYYAKGEREFLGLYVKEKNQFLIATAIDKEGLSKLSRLKIILAVVFFVTIILTAIGSYFFVNSALKPLKKLIAQIQETTENNLWKKVDEGNGKDEIAKIAINYNHVLELMKKAFEMQQIFVQHASHELRTPLTVMYATTESALNKNLSSEETNKILISLKEEQINLIELTNSLLVLYQLDQHKNYHHWRKLRVDELLYDAVSYCKKIFPGISIDFSFKNVPEEKELVIEADDNLLRAAFTNLIKNAFLYSNDKKLTLSILTEPDGLKIHFDNKGEHLTQQEVEVLKKPFVRSKDIGLIKGIGLGLSIVEKVLTFHNGHLIYTALPNSINRFTVQLKYS
ncbi:MAG: HAMP domain-containing histidine kinase [Chitinophagaceae bacterium]|nr:HAMP domain-containing histidine kinase [Chitinophagaceae bacterium]